MNQRLSLLLLALGLLLGSMACSSSDPDSSSDDGPDADAPNDEADASDEFDASDEADAGDDAGAEYLGLAQPERGFQIRSRGALIPASSDVEYCEVAELPGDPSDVYYVEAFELGNAALSHHLIVTAPEPGGVADGRIRELEVGDKVPCLSGQQAFGEIDHPSVYGIQQPYGRLQFPKGVGRVFHGGQRIVFDYHYFNVSDEDVEARSAINFHLTDEASIEHIADGFGFTNWTIDTPAGAQRSFKAECTFTEDVIVAGLTRHTHRWGTDFSVWFEGGEQHGEHLWTTTDWQHDIDFPLPAPRLMKAGEGFAFECSYDNTEERALRFGTNATDEMCILFGLIWSAGDEREVPSQDCDITWIDEDGVGHSPKGGGGMPAPSDGDRDLCLLGFKDTPTECQQCQCDECATPAIGCAFDADCKAMLDCFGMEGCDARAAIDEHSSAVGLLQQLQGCVASECTACE